MKLRSLTSRRPSAAIVISSAALFLSLGGVGYAATGLIGTNQISNGAVTYKKIAPNSVGQIRLANGGVINSKIANSAVSYKDIQPGAVGTVRANINQLQARVTGTCAAGSAVGTVSNKGAVTCNSSVPNEYQATGTATTLTGAATTTTSAALPSGASYLAFGNTALSATSGATAVRVTVSCTLTVGSSTQVRTVVLRTDGTVGDVSTASVPLQLAGAAGASTVSCTAAVPTGATLPATTATTSINALAVAANS